MSMQIGSRLRSMFAFVLMALLMLGSAYAPASVAAQAQSVQSQLTGVSITYGAPYALQADLGYADETLEMITFLGAADILSIGFMSPLIDLNGARDIMLEGLFGEGVTSAGIDRGDYTGVSYSLDMMNVDGSEMGVFSLFMNNRSHGYAEFYIFIAPPSLFAGTMQSAQNSFTIGGTPLMDGVDSTVMGNMVTANIGITGGTAVTNVTDVAGQTNTTEVTQPTQASQTTQADPNARTTYLAAVQAEFETVNADLIEFMDAFERFSQQTATAEEVQPIITATMETLSGTSGRAAAIQPPTGMEAFHQEFLAWAESMTAVGAAWANFVNGTGTVEDHRLALVDAIEAHTGFALTLSEELNATTHSPEQPAQPTATTDTTQQTTTTQTTGTDPDARAAYLEAVNAEFLDANQALTDWANAMQDLNAETITIDEARPIANGAMEVLAGTSDRAAAIQPPAGMETFHQEFLAWAEAMTNVGVVWAQFVDGTATSEQHTAAFTQAVDIHNTFADLLVSEMNAPTTQTADQPAQPTQATTATGTDANARSTYLEAVRVEYDAVTAELSTILGTLEAMTNETMPAADAVPILDAAHLVLAGTFERAAAIQPPAGMEAFHQEFQTWAQAMTDLGIGWADGVASGNLDAYNPLFSAALDAHTSFAISLETEMSATAPDETPVATEATRATRTTRSTTAETPTPTEATGATRTTRTVTTGSNGATDNERATYLQAVRAEYDHIWEQLILINITVGALNDETITAEVALADLTAANAELSGSAQRVQGIVPPAGMEDFHSRFLAWNETVVATGESWLTFTSQQIDADAYFTVLESCFAAQEDFGVALEAEEAAVGTASPVEETPVATEATGTTRTTRTTRTTATETAATTSDTSQGNSSETGGNAGLASVADSEWLMPENDVTITWGDSFAPDERDGPATESDPATTEDVIHLVWQSASGASEDLTITVVPPDSGDASAVVAALEADDVAAGEIFGEGAVLVESVSGPDASAALVQLNIPNADLWVFVQYTCIDANCDAMAIVLIVSGPENLPSLLADMEAGIAIDGVVISNAIPISDIQRALTTPGN